MAKFDRVEKILDYAINREVQSRKSYLALTKKTKDPACRIQELADEELCHQKGERIRPALSDFGKVSELGRSARNISAAGSGRVKT
jgi:hypothetical protein